MSEALNKTLFNVGRDLSTIERPPLLPKGEYEATIKSVAPKVSQRNTLYADVMFTIAPSMYPVDYDVENAPDGLDLAYRKCPLMDEDYPGNGKTWYLLSDFCRTIQAPLGEAVEILDWIGLQAIVVVDHETYDGVDREVIRKVKQL